MELGENRPLEGGETSLGVKVKGQSGVRTKMWAWPNMQIRGHVTAVDQSERLSSNCQFPTTSPRNSTGVTPYWGAENGTR